jgi:ligand-binding sensor domain-containing protein
LSENTVLQATQDSKGFLWFGTSNGLNRYDGYEFRVRRRGAPNAQLGGTTIKALCNDTAGQLWIGTDASLDRFDPVTETLTVYRHDDKGPTTLAGAVCAIAKDHDGQIWIGTSNGLDKFNAATGGFTHFRHDARDPNTLDAYASRNDIRFVGVDDSNTLWVETSAGINTFDPKTGKCSRLPQLLNRDEYHVQHVYQDRTRKLWIYSREGSGIGTFDPASHEFVQYRFITDDSGTQTAERVTAMLEDEAGQLWLGTSGSGMLRLDRKNGAVVRYRNDPADAHSLSNNFVACLYGDRKGNIWTGTGGGGINRFRAVRSGFISYQKRAGNRNSLDQNFVLSAFRDSDDVLWVANGGVLNRIDPQGAFTFYRHSRGAANSISDGTVLTTVEDGAGALWFGTYRGSLNSFDKRLAHSIHIDTSRQMTTHLPATSSIAWYSILEAVFGSLFITLDQFDPRSKRRKHFPELNDVLRSVGVTSLARDRLGVLWLGTEEAGLVRFDPAARHFNVYGEVPESAAKLSSNHINAVFAGSGPFLWVGTQFGLDRLDTDTQQVHTYSEQDGLPSNAVQGIVEDQRGDLWIGTDNGLARFSPATGRYENITSPTAWLGTLLTLGEYRFRMEKCSSPARAASLLIPKES